MKNYEGDRYRMNQTQKHALSWEFQSAAVDLLAARFDDGNIDESLKDLDWEQIARQIAVWIKRLPGDAWHLSLPDWEDQTTSRS